MTNGATYTLKNNKGNIMVLDSKGDTVHSASHTASTFSGASLTLFALYRVGYPPPTGGWNALYYCKIWDNDVLVRDFIPVKRKSDGVCGLYAIVNKIFYTNIGTGAFSGI